MSNQACVKTRPTTKNMSGKLSNGASDRIPGEHAPIDHVNRSADWQSAVSRIGNPQGFGRIQRVADYQSATQQVANLRYGRVRRARFQCPGLWLAMALIVTMAAVAQSEPFVPRDGGQVLERLRSTPFDPAARELRELRTRLNAEPQNLTLAAQFARRCIERSRSEADPRYLGRAQSALAPWWDAPAPPVEALVLRATFRQSQHDFIGALGDLDLALRLAPANAQARLTRATVLTVLGRYAEARRACLPLLQLTPGLVALTAVTSVTSLNGEAERGRGLLRDALERNPAAGIQEKVWALTVLAEISSQALGRTSEAEHVDFQNALALGQRDPYLLGAYADLLLDEDRAGEAMALLKEETRADGLLLRLALAESALTPRPASLEAHVADLRARFEASHLRGDFVHQREEARFTLWLLRQPVEALRLAQANWRVQHEPADARILLESALAARDAEAARPVLEFIRTNRLEDAQLNKLAKQSEVAAYQMKNIRMVKFVSPFQGFGLLGSIPRATLPDSLCPGLAYFGLSALGKGAWRILWLAGIVLLFAVGTARAHTQSSAYLTLRSTTTNLVGEWHLALRDLEDAVGLDANDDGVITWDELRARRAAVSAYALSRLHARDNAREGSLRVTDFLVDNHSDGAYAVLRFVVDGIGHPSAVELTYRAFFDIDPKHRGLLRLEDGGRTRLAVFGPETATQRFELTEAAPRTPFLTFVKEGVRHIWAGIRGSYSLSARVAAAGGFAAR